MAKYLDKWKDLFPDTVGGTTRPSEAVSDQEEFNTDGFPQFIAQDPVNYALQNAFLKQFLSNDAWLWVKQKQANQALDDHKVDTQAHAKGISGNAGSATKLKTARSINLSGAVTADAASFDGTADATINVKTLDASKLKGTTSVSTTGNAATATKLATARTIALSGNASGSATFDGSGNATINATVSESAHAATATKVVTNAASGASANIAEATMGGSDFARIRVSGANDAGELAIETADNGAEPIVARQYTGTSFKTVVRTAAILDGAGNTSFPGTVTAQKFTGALNGNAATASKLLTPRTISLTGKAAGSTSFDGSSNAAINVTSVNADTATKLATPRTISLSGNASGSANFDGSGNVSINTNVNHSDRAAYLDNFSAPHFRNFDTTKDTWDIIGPNPGTWLTSIRTEANAPNWLYGNFSAAIAFGGGDTKGAISVPYDGPRVKFAGGNGSKPVWYFSVGGSNGGAYNLDSFPTKTGGGASGTWGINISGNAASATNADKVDGYHASDLLRTLGGNRTPVITDIFDRAGTIDMSTMSAADKARHKANINKASNMTQNIWNNESGIHAYGGDYDIAGYNMGTLKLTQSYKNFDKILVVGVNDRGDLLIHKLWDVWALANAFASGSYFQLFHGGDYWFLYGSTRKGTNTNYALSTDTVWICQDQNSGIVAIYGIKY